MLGEMGRHGDQLLRQACVPSLNAGNFQAGKTA